MRHFAVFQIVTPLAILACASLLDQATLLAQTQTAATQPARSPAVISPDIRWGDTDISGLQMGIYQTNSSATIFCVIRNLGAEKVRFNDYYFDGASPNGVSLWARPIGKNADWTKLGLNELYIFISRGLGPTEKNKITLLPGRKYLTRLYPSRMNSTLPVDFEQSSRFISPFYYVWPAQWKGVVEYKIEQAIPDLDENDKDLWTGTLVSGVLQNDVDEIRRRQLQAFESSLAFQEKIDAQSQTKSEFVERRKERMRVFIETLKAEQEENAP